MSYDERVKQQQQERRRKMLDESRANLESWYSDREAEDQLYQAPENLHGLSTRKHGPEHTQIKSKHFQPKRDSGDVDLKIQQFLKYPDGRVVPVKESSKNDSVSRVNRQMRFDCPDLK